MRRIPLLLVALAFAPACSDAEPAGSATVDMTEDQRFAPAQLRVKAGTTVTFDNVSAEAHTVTAYQGEIPDDAQYFTSGGFGTEQEARDNLADAIVGQEETVEVTFDVAGTYEYFCIPHERQGMKGTIVVEE
jgi:plastocyanin